MSQLLNALGQMITEQRNPNSMNIDRLSALDIVQVINQEDKQVAIAVEQCLPQIAQAVEKLCKPLRKVDDWFMSVPARAED